MCARANNVRRSIRRAKAGSLNRGKRKAPARGRRLATPYETLEARHLLTADLVQILLLRDTGADATDGVTTDPRIVGIVEELSDPTATVDVEIDFGAEGTVDHVASGLHSTSQFVLDLRELGAVPGTVTLQVREILSNDAGSTTGAWHSFEFTYQSESAPQLVVLVEGQQLFSGTSTIDFGGTPVGTPATRDVTLQNVGDAPLTLAGHVFTPPGYSVDEPDEPGGQLMLGAGQSVTVEVRLDAVRGGVHSGQFVVFSDDPIDPAFSVTVTGTVLSPVLDARLDGQSMLAPFSYVDFGSLGAGQQSERTLEFVNSGDLAVTIESVALPAGFSLSQSFSPIVIQPGSTSQLAIWFNGPSTGVFEGALEITTDQEGLGTLAVHLVGEIDSPRIAIEVAGQIHQTNKHPVYFGSTFVGQSVSQEIVVRNFGNATLVIEPDFVLPEGFTIDTGGASLSIAPGDSRTFTLQMSATQTGLFGGRVELASNDHNQPVFNLLVQGNVVALAQLGLYADTSTVDGTTSDPRVAGRIAGFVSQSALIDVDWDGDQLADVSLAPRIDGRFVIDPQSVPGSMTVYSRLVTLDGSGERRASGAWEAVSAVLDPEDADLAPTLTGLALVNDTGPSDSDNITHESAIRGTVGNDGATFDLTVLVDHDGDEVVDGMAQVGEDGSFIYRPQSLETGSNTLSFWAVETTYAGEDLASAAESFAFELVVRPAPVVTEFRLKNDSGNSNDDQITIDPTLIGQVEWDGDLGSLFVEIDLNSDGWADGYSVVDEDGAFEYRPSRLPAGNYDAAARAREPSSSSGSWDDAATTTFVLKQPTAPTFSNVRVANVAHQIADQVYVTDPTIEGEIGGEYLMTSHVIEFDHDGDGMVDGRTASNSQGQFTYTPQHLGTGEATVSYRAVTLDPLTGRSVNGAWSSISFIYEGPHSPEIINLEIGDEGGSQTVGGTGEGGGGGGGSPVIETNNPTFRGEVSASQGLVAMAAVEFDVDGDGLADEVTYTDYAGAFEHKLRVAPGTMDVGIRAKVWDPVRQTENAGEWLTIGLAVEVDTRLDPPQMSDSSSGSLPAANQAIADIDGLVGLAASKAADTFNSYGSGGGGGVGGVPGGSEGGGSGGTTGLFKFGIFSVSPLIVSHGQGFGILGELGYENSALVAAAGFDTPLNPATSTSSLVSRTVNTTLEVTAQSGDAELDGSIVANSSATINTIAKTFSVSATFSYSYAWASATTSITGSYSLTLSAQGSYVVVSGAPKITTGTFSIDESGDFSASLSSPAAPYTDGNSQPSDVSTITSESLYDREFVFQSAGVFTQGDYSGSFTSEDTYSLSHEVELVSDYMRSDDYTTIGAVAAPAHLAETIVSTRDIEFVDNGIFSRTSGNLQVAHGVDVLDTRFYGRTVEDGGPLAVPGATGTFSTTTIDEYLSTRHEIGTVTWTPSGVTTGDVTFTLGEEIGHNIESSLSATIDTDTPELSQDATFAGDLAYDGDITSHFEGGYSLQPTGIDWSDGQYELSGTAEHSRTYSIVGEFTEHLPEETTGTFSRNFTEQSTANRTDNGSMTVASSGEETLDGTVFVSGDFESHLTQVLTINSEDLSSTTNSSVDHVGDYTDEFDYVQASGVATGSGEYTFHLTTTADRAVDATMDYVDYLPPDLTVTGTTTLSSNSDLTMNLDDSGTYEVSGADIDKTGAYQRDVTEFTEVTIDDDSTIRSPYDDPEEPGEGLHVVSENTSTNDETTSDAGAYSDGAPPTDTIVKDQTLTTTETTTTSGSTSTATSKTTINNSQSTSHLSREVHDEQTYEGLGSGRSVTGSFTRDEETDVDTEYSATTEYWIAEPSGSVMAVAVDYILGPRSGTRTDVNTTEGSSLVEEEGNYQQTGSVRSEFVTFTTSNTIETTNSVTDAGHYGDDEEHTFSENLSSTLNDTRSEQGTRDLPAGSPIVTVDSTFSQELSSTSSGESHEHGPVKDIERFQGTRTITSGFTSELTLTYSNGTYVEDAEGSRTAANFNRQVSDDSHTETVTSGQFLPPEILPSDEVVSNGVVNATATVEAFAITTSSVTMTITTAMLATLHEWGTETTVSGNKSVHSQGADRYGMTVRDADYTSHKEATTSETTETVAHYYELASPADVALLTSLTVATGAAIIPVIPLALVGIVLPGLQQHSTVVDKESTTQTTDDSDATLTDHIDQNGRDTWRSGHRAFNNLTKESTEARSSYNALSLPSASTEGTSVGWSRESGSSTSHESREQNYIEDGNFAELPDGSSGPLFTMSGTLVDTAVASSSIDAKSESQGATNFLKYGQSPAGRSGIYQFKTTSEAKASGYLTQTHNGTFERSDELLTKEGSFSSWEVAGSNYKETHKVLGGNLLSLDDLTGFDEAFPPIDDPAESDPNPPVQSADGTKWSFNEQARSKGWDNSSEWRSGQFEARLSGQTGPYAVVGVPTDDEGSQGDEPPVDYELETGSVVRARASDHEALRTTSEDSYYTSLLPVFEDLGIVTVPVQDPMAVEGPTSYFGLPLPAGGKFIRGMVHDSILFPYGDTHEYSSSRDVQTHGMLFAEWGELTTVNGGVADESTRFTESKSQSGSSQAEQHTDRDTDIAQTTELYSITINGQSREDGAQTVTSGGTDVKRGSYAYSDPERFPSEHPATPGEEVSRIDTHVRRERTTTVKSTEVLDAQSETTTTFSDGDTVSGSGNIDQEKSAENRDYSLETGTVSYIGGRAEAPRLDDSPLQAEPTDGPVNTTENLTVTIEQDTKEVVKTTSDGQYTWDGAEVDVEFAWEFRPVTVSDVPPPPDGSAPAADGPETAIDGAQYNRFLWNRYRNTATFTKSDEPTTTENSVQNYRETTLRAEGYTYNEDATFAFAASLPGIVDNGYMVAVPTGEGGPLSGTWHFDRMFENNSYRIDVGTIIDLGQPEGTKSWVNWGQDSGQVDHTIDQYDWQGNGPWSNSDIEIYPEAEPGVFETFYDGLITFLSDPEARLDMFQAGLDILGFVPVVGDAVDLVNGAISWVRGNKLEAGLSFAAAIPFVGSAMFTTAKVAVKYGDDVLLAAKSATGLGRSKDVVEGGASLQKVLRGGDDVLGGAGKGADNAADAQRGLQNASGKTRPGGAPAGAAKSSDELGTRTADPKSRLGDCKAASKETPILFSHTSTGPRASAELLDAMRSHGRTIKFATEGSDELRYLNAMGAEANVGGPGHLHILLRENPSKAAALEEFLHGTQSRLGIIDRLGPAGAEAHVESFMLRHKKLLGLE